MLHVEVGVNDSTFRPATGARITTPAAGLHRVVLHRGRDPRQVESRILQPVDLALETMAECVPSIEVLCALDSALHHGVISRRDLERLRGVRWLRLLGRADGRAESGTETIFRVRATEAGFHFGIQVAISVDVRVDFLFGDGLIVEVDGAQHHSGSEEFARDRDRDAWLTWIGFHVVHFSYDQVVNRWTEIEAILTRLHRDGAHRRGTRWST
jgi:very-short-patch-repair endonuclease